MLVHRRVTPSIKFAGTHLYTWVERGTVRVKCLTQEHSTMSPARAWTRTARSGVERTNHEATAPPSLIRMTFLFSNVFGAWIMLESNVWTSLQTLKLDMTQITSGKKVISIEHRATAIFVLFWLVLPLKKRRTLYGLVKNRIVLYLQIFNTQNLSLGSILKIFLKFRNLQPRYCYKKYCTQSNRLIKWNTYSQLLKKAIFNNYFSTNVLCTLATLTTLFF